MRLEVCVSSKGASLSRVNRGEERRFPTRDRARAADSRVSADEFIASLQNLKAPPQALGRAQTTGTSEESLYMLNLTSFCRDDLGGDNTLWIRAEHVMFRHSLRFLRK